ncbi:MAG: hypothetical protein M3037_08185 [Gemmatimonadota bacterium]|nr:hypothetical protein [Gemmatimonadota bacterium]
MNGEPNIRVEDRLRVRLRELDAITVFPYATPTERVGRPRSSVPAVAVAVVGAALIVLGAIVGNQLRESQRLAPGGTAAQSDCGARTSQLDAAGRLVGVSKDSTTILVRPLAEVRSDTETWLDWYMTGTALLSVYAQSEDGSRIEPSFNEPIGQDAFLVRLAFPKGGCWQLHAERGKVGGDLWLQVLAPGALAGSPNYANIDCSATSWRDPAGRLMGTTRDSTAILVSVPAEVRATIENAFDWEMTSGEASPLTVYAQYADGSRVAPRSIETLGSDTFRVRLVFPKSGCWRLHSERIGGKLSGDVWVQVLPVR